MKNYIESFFGDIDLFNRRILNNSLSPGALVVISYLLLRLVSTSFLQGKQIS